MLVLFITKRRMVMSGNTNQWPFKKAIAYLIMLLLSLTILYLIIKLSPYLGNVLMFFKKIFLPFFIALIISYLLHPIVNLLHGRGIPRSLAVLLIYILFFGTLTIITINALPMLIKQTKELGENLPNMFKQFELWIDGLDNIRHDHTNPLPDSFQDGIDSTIEDLEYRISLGFQNSLGIISNTIGILFTIFLVPFVAFYMLKDYKLLEKAIITFVPKKSRKEMIRLARDIDEALGNYIRGQLIVCTIIGTLAYIGYLIIDLPYALLLASIVGITNIIPYLGPFIGATPAVIVGFTVSWKLGLSVLTVNIIIQIIEGNIVSPQIVGRKLHIHPLFIIMALLLGGQIGGIAGLILAVPTFAIIKVIVQHIGIYYTTRRNS